MLLSLSNSIWECNDIENDGKHIVSAELRKFSSQVLMHAYRRTHVLCMSTCIETALGSRAARVPAVWQAPNHRCLMMIKQTLHIHIFKQSQAVYAARKLSTVWSHYSGACKHSQIGPKGSIGSSPHCEGCFWCISSFFLCLLLSSIATRITYNTISYPAMIP